MFIDYLVYRCFNFSPTVSKISSFLINVVLYRNCNNFTPILFSIELIPLGHPLLKDLLNKRCRNTIL